MTGDRATTDSSDENNKRPSTDLDSKTYNEMAVQGDLIGNNAFIDNDDNRLDHYLPEAAEEEEEEDRRDLNAAEKGLESEDPYCSPIGFWDCSLRSYRMQLVRRFLMVYLIMAVCILSIFSIYWGSLYDRDSKYHNLKILVVIEDKAVDGIPPLFGDTLRNISDSKAAYALGGFHVKNQSEMLTAVSRHHETSVEQEITRLIHHQEYWSSIYIRENTTYNFYQALKDADASYNLTENGPQVIYETGRDFQAMINYVTPNVMLFEKLFLAAAPTDIYSKLVQMLSDSEKSNLIDNAPSLIATPPMFTYIDNRLFTDQVLLAPSQVGLIYLVILTFFQFNFFVAIHMETGQKNLRITHHIVYRMISSFFSYLIISLIYCFVSLAFQVNMQKAFGKSGFLVMWSVSFLTMSSLGVFNEIMALICFSTYPPVAGFWLLFWVMINIAPTFSPMALTDRFYKYGYGVPVHNSYEATKVIFFDTYKGQFGRNIGILIAWIVIGNCILPFALKFAGKRLGEKKKKEIADILSKNTSNN